MSELRTRVLKFEDRKDGYTEVTMLVDRNRDKAAFPYLVNAYRDDKIIVLELKNNA